MRTVLPLPTFWAVTAASRGGFAFLRDWQRLLQRGISDRLALQQGGYDCGFLVYAVGFGGSMLWFGSSAGVAVSNLFPEANSVGQWLRHGWKIPVGYVIGFMAMPVVLGRYHREKHEKTLC